MQAWHTVALRANQLSVCLADLQHWRCAQWGKMHVCMQCGHAMVLGGWAGAPFACKETHNVAAAVCLQGEKMKAAAAERERRQREEMTASKAAQGSKHLIKQLQHKRFRQVCGPGRQGGFIVHVVLKPLQVWHTLAGCCVQQQRASCLHIRQSTQR